MAVSFQFNFQNQQQQQQQSNMSAVNELRQLLKQGPLYTHLTDTLLKIAIEKPADAFEKFEQLSSSIKHNPYRLNGEKAEQQQTSSPSKEHTTEKNQWASKVLNQVKVSCFACLFVCLFVCLLEQRHRSTSFYCYVHHCPCRSHQRQRKKRSQRLPMLSFLI